VSYQLCEWVLRNQTELTNAEARLLFTLAQMTDQRSCELTVKWSELRTQVHWGRSWIREVFSSLKARGLVSVVRFTGKSNRLRLNLVGAGLSGTHDPKNDPMGAGLSGTLGDGPTGTHRNLPPAPPSWSKGIQEFEGKGGCNSKIHPVAKDIPHSAPPARCASPSQITQSAHHAKPRKSPNFPLSPTDRISLERQFRLLSQELTAISNSVDEHRELEPSQRKSYAQKRRKVLAIRSLLGW
jgi:hypothetical protein